MKKIIKGLIVLSVGLFFSIGVIAQPPGRPPTGLGFAGNQNPLGAPTGAPIQPGTGILLILGLGYGLSKIYSLRNKTSENTEA